MVAAKVEDVGLHADGPAGNLFGGNVIGGSLNAFLDGADFTGLTEVNDFYLALVGTEDVIGLEIAVGIAQGVHGFEALGGLNKGIDDFDHVVGRTDVKRPAIDQFHEQKSLFGLSQDIADDLQIV